MSVEDEHGLDAIRGPSTPPSSEPDPLAQGEIEKYRKPTPTDRLEAANLVYRKDLQTQRDRLQEEVRNLRAELDALRPRYTALVESRRGLAGTAGIAAFLVAIGGFILAVAGFISDRFHAYRLVGVCVGATMFLIGFGLQFHASRQARLFQHDHLEEGSVSGAERKAG